MSAVKDVRFRAAHLLCVWAEAGMEREVSTGNRGSPLNLEQNDRTFEQKASGSAGAASPIGSGTLTGSQPSGC